MARGGGGERESCQFDLLHLAVKTSHTLWLSLMRDNSIRNVWIAANNNNNKSNNKNWCSMQQAGNKRSKRIEQKILFPSSRKKKKSKTRWRVACNNPVSLALPATLCATTGTATQQQQLRRRRRRRNHNQNNTARPRLWLGLWALAMAATRAYMGTTTGLKQFMCHVFCT